MEVQYVVTYRPEIGEPVVCKAMNGTELANLYGFSDCSGVIINRVWEVNNDGDLEKVVLRDNRKQPYNWLIIENEYGEEIERYEWNEH